MTNSREMTLGEKTVDLTFNPSDDDRVQHLKIIYAAIIDELNAMQKNHNKQTRLTSIAITETQGAQIQTMKAVTWKD